MTLPSLEVGTWPRAQLMRDTEARRVLAVGADASQDEIRRAYRRAALRWHPDKNTGDTEAATMRFRQVRAAYLALQERAPDEGKHDVQNDRHEHHMPTFEDSLRAFHSIFGNAAAASNTSGCSLAHVGL